MDLVDQSHHDNRDGWGVMYADEFGLHVKRGMDSKDYMEFSATIAPDTPAVLHTRIGTSGTKTIDNCHPFRIGRDFALMHNGIISIDRPEQQYSDTWHFVQDVVGPMLQRRPQLFGSEALKMLLSKVIGGSKLVLMNKDGEIMIVNERAGRWYKGLWVSNERSLYGLSWKDRSDHWKLDPAYPGDKAKETTPYVYSAGNYNGSTYNNNYTPAPVRPSPLTGTAFQQSQRFAHYAGGHHNGRELPRYSQSLERMVWPHETLWATLPATLALGESPVIESVYTPQVPITETTEALIEEILSTQTTVEPGLISSVAVIDADGTVVQCTVN